MAKPSDGLVGALPGTGVGRLTFAACPREAIGAAVTGGVSLFGGRGRVGGVVLGSLVIARIANGTHLVGYSAAARYIITAAILVAAMTLDSASRRRLAASAR